MFLALFSLQANPTSAQSSILTVTPLTWNVIGLDSNSPTTGPQYFPVGARVCNTSGSAMSNVLVELNWTTASSFIDIRSGTDGDITIPTLAAGACYDAYFEVEIDQVAGAYGATRGYTITATNGVETGSTPTPRFLLVERLISQNRNATTSVLYGTSLGTLTPVAAGGTMSLFVGETYFIRLVGSTATQGYEQLEAFLTLSNTIFQINSVSTTYSADSSSTVPGPNPSLYANGCNWENDPNSPNYLACNSTGKAGGSVTTTYEVTILSGGGTTQTLNSLLYDFSGSSFHYNSDFSVGARFAAIIDPSGVTIAKSFTPDPISTGGVSTLTFTLTNPNGAALSGLNFTDSMPGAVTVATPATFSTSGCGTPTFSPTAGSSNLSFSNGSIAANGTCTISVQVTSSTVATHSNTTSNLLIGSIDTGNSASDTLTVTNTPLPPACTAGFPLATWTFDTGTATNPTPATGSGTAAAGAGLGNVAIGGTWSATNISNSPTLNTALDEYFEFTIDTTGLTSIDLQFQALRSANGAANVQVFFGSPSPTTASTVFGPITTTLTTFGPTTISGVNSSGNTIFRIYAYNTSQDNGGHGLTIDNVSFTGCGIPSVPTLTKAFSTNPIGVGGTTNLVFTLTNPNTWIALTGAGFSDSLPTGMTISGAASTTCTGSPSITATIGTSSVTVSGATIAINSSCTVTVPVTSSTAGPATNISGFISSTQSGQNSTSTGSGTATLTVLAPPQISKQFAPNPILTTASGGVSILTFTITNPNQNNAISSVAFSDTFPGGLLINDTPNASTNCTSGTVTATANTNVVSLSGATIAAGASCTVSVRVDAVAAGNYANTSGNVSHVVSGTPFNGNTATDTLTVNAPNPSITTLKQVGLSSSAVSCNVTTWLSYASVAVGSPVCYQITVENTGDVALNNIIVSDPNVNTAGCTWTNPLPVADASDDDHIDTCIIGPISAVAGVQTNTATVTTNGVPPTDTSTAVYATSAIMIAKVASPTIYTAAGNVISYTFTVENTGFSTLNGPVTVADNRSTDETCPSLTTVGDADAFFDPGEILICTATYTITGADVTAGSVTNTATATAGGITSNIATATVTTTSQADLSITKTDGVATYTPGGSVIYTIVASNAGPSAVTGATVADTLPAAVTSASWTCAGAGGGTCAASGTGSINESVNLPVGGSVTFTVTANISATATGDLVNTATVTPPVGTTDPAPGNNTSTDTDTADPEADLSITKTDSATTYTPGGSVIYTIVASNAGPSAVTGATVADTFPAAVTSASWTCAGAGGGTCTAAGTGDISDTVNLPVGGSVTFTVTANISATATADLVNTATVTPPVGTTDPAPGNNTSTDTDTADPEADLSITKTDGSTTYTPGGTVTYTIVASNAGPIAVTGATVADTFPADLSNINWTCAGAGGGTCTAAGTGNISDTVNLPVGASVTYTVTADIAAGATGNLVNTATVTEPAGVTDPTPGNNTATDTDTPTTINADLSITKTDGATTYTPGGSVTYTIVASNAGPTAVTGATVADTFPADLSNINWTCVGAGGGTCTAAGTGDISDTVNLPVGASVTYTVTADIAAGATGNLVNTATVTEPAGVTDPTPGNNTATDTDTPAATSADLSITKTDGATTYTPGGTVTYTIVASNAGPTAVTGATVADTFPADLSNINWTCVGAGGGTCTAAGTGNISDTVNLPVGASVTYTVTADIAAGATGNLVNTATVTAPAGITDPTPANNSATDTDTQVGVPPVPPVATSTPVPSGAVIVVFDPAISKIGFLLPGEIGLQNERIEWFFTVTNIGNATGTNVVVSDTMRPELRIDSLNVSAPLTSNVSGQTITVTIPSLAPGQTVNFSVVTTVISGGGTIENTACLTASNLLGERCVTAPAILTQPPTGETPWWRSLLLGLVVVMGVAASAVTIWMLRRRQNT